MHFPNFISKFFVSFGSLNPSGAASGKNSGAESSANASSGNRPGIDLRKVGDALKPIASRFVQSINMAKAQVRQVLCLTIAKRISGIKVAAQCPQQVVKPEVSTNLPKAGIDWGSVCCVALVAGFGLYAVYCYRNNERAAHSSSLVGSSATGAPNDVRGTLDASGSNSNPGGRADMRIDLAVLGEPDSTGMTKRGGGRFQLGLNTPDSDRTRASDSTARGVTVGLAEYGLMMPGSASVRLSSAPSERSSVASGGRMRSKRQQLAEIQAETERLKREIESLIQQQTQLSNAPASTSELAATSGGLATTQE